MPFRHRKASLALLSVLGLTLSACQPASTTPGSTLPQITPSASPADPLPGTSPVPSASAPPATPTPTPVFSITPGASNNPSSGSTATVNLSNGTRLVIALPNRFLSSKGQSVQLNAQLFDATGQALPLGNIKLLFSSSRPLDFSVSDAGVVTALKDSGYSTLSVRVEGTDLTASQLISVDTFVGGSSGGGSSSPSASPTPLTQVNANVNFDGLGIGEFKLNTYTTDSQSNPAVAMDADGDFVVTWHSYTQDGGGYGIYAQRYNKDGVAQGSEFRVNTYTANNQINPSVAMDADGDFVVTWSSNQYGISNGIYAQRYSADGSVNNGAQGSEFRVNTYTTNTQINPSIAMDADGDFVVTWQSRDQDGSSYGIYAQRYSADGSVNNGAQGSAFRVNTYTTNTQINPAVAMDADGDFVVTWQSRNGSYYGSYAQRYSADGSVSNGAQGSEFKVNTYTTNTTNSFIAMDADGDFVVTWQSRNGSSYDIYAQRYDKEGSVNNGVQGSEFRVNTYTANAQQFSAVAMDADGDFVVTWQSNYQDGDFYGIYAKQYTPNGMAK